MKSKKRISKSVIMIILAVTMFAGVIQVKYVQAASKPSLAKSVTLVEGEKKSLPIKPNGYIITRIQPKSSNYSIASVRNVNGKVRIVGKTAGKTTITTTVRASKNKEVKVFKFKTKVIVKAPTKDKATVTEFSDLKATLSSMPSTGGTVTLNSTNAGEFTIEGGNYSKISLIVNTPSANIVNKATFKDVTIKAIAKEGWSEETSGNNYVFESNSPISFMINRDRTVSSISFMGDVFSAVQSVKVLGTLKRADVKNIAPAEISSMAETSTVGLVNIDKNGAKVTVDARLGSTVSTIHATQPCNIELTGDSTGAIVVEKIDGAILSAADTLTGVIVKKI